MKCILEGHKPVTEEGRGEYAGRKSTYCSVCNNIIENVSEPQRRPTVGDLTYARRRERGGYAAIQRSLT